MWWSISDVFVTIPTFDSTSSQTGHKCFFIIIIIIIIIITSIVIIIIIIIIILLLLLLLLLLIIIIIINIILPFFNIIVFFSYYCYHYYYRFILYSSKSFHYSNPLYSSSSSSLFSPCFFFFFPLADPFCLSLPMVMVHYTMYRYLQFEYIASMSVTLNDINFHSFVAVRVPTLMLLIHALGSVYISWCHKYFF